MKITDNKIVYNEFKYFKNIYTKINIAESIQFTGNSTSKSINAIFLRDSSFSELFGIFTGETKFFEWLLEGDKTVLFKMEDIIKIGKCLKKNAIDIEYDDTTFQYNFTDKDGNTMTVALSTVVSPLTLKTARQNFNSTFELSSDYFITDILEVFNNEGNITKSRTKDKIIEIPRDRINSLIKGQVLEISFSEKDDISSRYVSLSSSNEALGLTLTEIFRTI